MMRFMAISLYLIISCVFFLFSASASDKTAAEDAADQRQWKPTGSYPLQVCTDILKAVNNSGKLLNYDEFPLMAEIFNPSWRIVVGAQASQVAQTILSYRFSSDIESFSADNSSERSGVLSHYQNLAQESRLLLQHGYFDIDGDGKKDGVYRMGVLIDDPESLLTRNAFGPRRDNVSGWEYIVSYSGDSKFLSDYKALDSGQVIGAGRPFLVGNFIYQGAAIFYSLSDEARFFTYAAPLGSRDKGNVICSLTPMEVH